MAEALGEAVGVQEREADLREEQEGEPDPVNDGDWVREPELVALRLSDPRVQERVLVGAAVRLTVGLGDGDQV